MDTIQHANRDPIAQAKSYGRSLIKRLQWLLPAASLIVLPISSSNAAVELSLDIDVGIVHSDNIFLDGGDNEQSETVYMLAPLFVITSENNRIDADIRYRPQGYWYSTFDDANEVYHTLDVSTQSSIIRDRLFLDVSATRFQSIETPDGQTPANNIPITGNRGEAQTLQARPYWSQPIGSSRLMIGGDYYSVEFDDQQFQDSHEVGGFFEFGNLESQQGFAWQIDFMHRRTEYDISLPWEFQRASVNLGAWINESVRLFTVGGAETAFNNLGEPNLDSDFWEVGFQYAPSPRLNLEIAIGDRSYGTSARGEFRYRSRRGQIRVTYSEGPENRSALLRERRPLALSNELDGALDRFGESDRFVRKRGEATWSIELPKSEWVLRAFSERRKFRTSADGLDLGDESILGGTVEWSWRLGSRTTFGISGDVAERKRLADNDTLLRIELDLAYNLGQRVSLQAQVARVDQNGDRSVGLEYAENQYRLFLRSSF